MLKKEKRLSAAEVRAVLKEGRVVRGVSLLAKYTKAPEGRAAVAVSKKIAHHAVDRNRIRRAVYQTLQDALPAHVHAVFLVQKNVSDYTDEVTSLCSKLSS